MQRNELSTHTKYGARIDELEPGGEVSTIHGKHTNEQ